jgi:cardiolipin synthase A/B
MDAHLVTSARRALSAMTAAVLALAAGCASVPDIDKAIGPLETARPEIVGAHGPLSAKQRQAVLDRLKKQDNGGDLLAQHLAIEQAVAETPLVVGNRTRILHDGDSTFREMFRVMRAAKNHINLEYYIVQDVESGGERLGDLLIAKRREGVAVNLMYDSYGSMATASEFFDRLRTSGISVIEFNPINPLRARSGYSLNGRDHRKILVVDGKMAIIGGVNLFKGYQNGSGNLTGSDGGPSEFWHDTDLEIEGPAVAEVQRLFLDHWREQEGPPLDTTRFFPAVPAAGGEILRILGSNHRDLVPRYYATLISAIRDAQTSIRVTAAYFVPTHDELEALERAARRSVDVRLLLPSMSDAPLALDAGRSHYSDLMEAGVKIYELQNEMLHSKTVTIDGVWSIIGSSNFDQRSILFNDEIDAVVLGRETAAQFEAQFGEDMQTSKAIDPRAWADRPLFEKFREMLSRIWQTLL